VRRRLEISRRLSASVSTSPVLVGAITTVTVIVAMYLSYQANRRIPFVPTYELRAELPSGSNLVDGNEVRAGGFRVGIIDTLTTEPKRLPDGQIKAIAVAHLKLDKVIQPLATDSQLVVRPQSTVGLKYLEITPGNSKQTFAAGGTIPLANSSQPVELDDLLDTFDQTTRESEQKTFQGLGDAVAGRGGSINRSIEALAPLLGHLAPVMHNLSAPNTGLDNLLRQLDITNSQLAPVANIQGELFTNMEKTFGALSADPNALTQTIRKSPPTEDTSIQSFRTQRPFLADATDLSNRLRPAAQELPRSLPTLNVALHEGQPVLRDSVALDERTGDFFQAVTDLAHNPNTLPALQNLTQFASLGRPLISTIAPYQTVCNYWNYWWYTLGEHQSENTGAGTAERALNFSDNHIQPNAIANGEAMRPVDVPQGQNPHTATTPTGPQEALHAQPHPPAVDAHGNANCQSGQNGYMTGPLADTDRYPPSSDPTKGGGSHVVGDNTPVLNGPTYTGVPNLQAVP
jgi:virulence factor Mce-like protein